MKKAAAPSSRSAQGRRDPSTAQRIVDAAEALFARHGLEGVSLRQISAGAGCGDNYAVQYHFGDVDGLIAAILARRMPELELRRAERLAQVRTVGPLTTRTLLDVLLRPIVEHRDAQGEPTFARFSLALHCSAVGVRHLDEAFEQAPLTRELIDQLQRENPHLPAPVVWNRLLRISGLVQASICNRLPPYDGTSGETPAIEEALDMAAAAMSVPLDPLFQAQLQQGRSPVAQA